MKILKWIGISVVSLLIIIAALVFFQVKKAEKILARTVQIDVVPLEIPYDSISLEIGKKWATLCGDCHAPDLGGKMFIDDPGLGKLYAPNITRGEGGLSYYTDKDWLAALRHGVSPTGKPLMIMPSKSFAQMRAEDIGGIIAYMKKAAPPVDRPNEVGEFKTFGKLLIAMGAFDEDFGVNHIDHKAPVPPNISNQAPKDRGKYLTSIIGCESCHGKSLNGKIPNDPNSPPATNLTPAGNLGSWSYDDFSSFLKTGTTKEGKTVDNAFMPWQAYGKLPQEELEAVFTYIKSLEPLETGY